MKTIKLLFIVFIGVYVFICALIFFLQEKLIFLPETLPRDFKYSFESEFDEHFLEISDGAMINALHFRQENAKGLIVYFHGNAGSLERWGEIVAPFVSMGYEVLISDYRGYGKSTGKRSKAALMSDAEAIYSFAKTLADEDKVILFGRSLGSSFASYLAGKNQPSKLILETPFYSVQDVANRMFPIFPVATLLRYNFRNNSYLKDVNAQVYIFHGTADEVVPYDSGQKLSTVLPPQQSELITIEGGHHNDLAAFDAYWMAMNRVLENE